MSVTAPPRGPDTEHEHDHDLDLDLERRVADLEALIREARRRARRRRILLGAVLVAAGATAAGLAGVYGGAGSGAGATASVGHSGANGQSGGPAPSLAALPYGNEAQAFAFDPRRPNVVYVASPDARGGAYVFKTTDGGRDWRSTTARGGLWRSDILSLTADPLHSGTLYAGTDTAVYKTVNGGRSWQPFNRGLFPHLRHPPCTSAATGLCVTQPHGKPGAISWNRDNGYVLDVAVDPTDNQIVYSAADGIRRSTNGGRTWKVVFGRSRTWEWRNVTRIAIAPTRPESVYAIAHTGAGATAIFKSISAGRSWRMTGGSQPTLPPSCCGDSEDALAIDPTNPQVLYAAVGGNTVLATTDGGASWHPAASGLPAKAVISLATDPRRPGTAYAGVEISHSYKSKSGPGERSTGGVYRTTDSGGTWTPIWTGFGVEHVAVDPSRPSTIFAAGFLGGRYGADQKGCGLHPSCVWRYGLIRSTNSGRTWTIAR